MNAFQVSSIATAILSFAFGFFIFVNNRRSHLSRTWFNASLAISIWSLALFGVVSASRERSALLWQYLLDGAATLIPVFYFHFILTFLNLDEKKKLAKKISKVLGLLFFLLSFTPLIKLGVTKLFFGFYWVQPGPFYLLYLFYFSFYVIYTLYLLLLVYRTSSGSFRNQIGAVIVAEVVGFGGGITNFYPPFFNVFPLGNYLVAFYIIFISYAIIRQGLFDLRVIATEIFSALLAVALLIDFLASQTAGEYFLRGILLVGTMVFSYFLIRSVFQEIRLREEIERLADNLKKANAELKKLDQLKSEFLSLASHQLRTPLSIIKGYISMIQEGSFGQIPDKAREVLRKVYFSNERMINLVSDFLNISRIESGRMRYDFEPARIEDVIENVVGEFQEAAHDKKIDLMWERPGTPLPEAMLDKEKFHQVIMNLVDNALRYTQVGFIKIKVEPDRAKDGHILVSVRDSGVGMTPEEIDQTFKRFSRGAGGSKVNTGGLGLGLYLAKRIVNDHGGEIWAESKGRGQGSTFLIRLPAQAREVQRAAQFNEFVDKI